MSIEAHARAAALADAHGDERTAHRHGWTDTPTHTLMNVDTTPATRAMIHKIREIEEDYSITSNYFSTL